MSEPIDRTDPEAVANAMVAAVIARDYGAVESLTKMSKREQAELEREGTTYGEMLELLWSIPDSDVGGEKPLPDLVEQLYSGALEMHIGEIPAPGPGKIAAGVIGETGPDGERVLVTILFEQPDGTWLAVEPPKTLPSEKIAELG